MSRPSYAKALDKLLQPLGFHREGMDWIRVRGDMWECVNLQRSWLGGVTVNVSMKDLVTEAIIASIPCDQPLFSGEISVRIGQLIDRHDRWWTKDPDGPAPLATAVETYGLPWLDRVRTLEDLAAIWESDSDRNPWRHQGEVAAAVLHRLGRTEEALAMFDAPVPRTANPSLVESAKCVQKWLRAQLGRD